MIMPLAFLCVFASLRWVFNSLIPKHPALRLGRRRRREAEVLPAAARGDAAARGARQEALLDQERFDHILDRAALFADGGGQRIPPPRPAVKAFDKYTEQTPVERVEAFLVNAQHDQRLFGDLTGEHALALYLAEGERQAPQAVRAALQ